MCIYIYIYTEHTYSRLREKQAGRRSTQSSQVAELLSAAVLLTSQTASQTHALVAVDFFSLDPVAGPVLAMMPWPLLGSVESATAAAVACAGINIRGEKAAGPRIRGRGVHCSVNAAFASFSWPVPPPSVGQPCVALGHSRQIELRKAHQPTRGQQ